MSSTNQAFIKAYRHDQGQSDGAHAPRPAGTDHARSGKLAGSRGDAPSVATKTAAMQSRGAVRTAPAREVGSTEKRPLSSFIAAPQPTQELRVDAGEQSTAFQAGTTVASFQWPVVCRALMQTCGPQLDQVTRLLWARAGAGNSLIGVFGLFCGSGATTMAMCLASRAAIRGQRVIVGDGNFRSPRLASLLEAVPTAGWEEVLKHSAPLQDAVIHATDENLDVLALGNKLLSDPLPVVGGLQAAVTAGILRHAYGLSILDLGAFFDPVSQPIFLELVSNLGVDAAVAVAGPAAADRRDLATIIEQLDRTGCEFLGVVENRIALKAA
jgi:Mrp family chromosome partitioning ATPase